MTCGLIVSVDVVVMLLEKETTSRIGMSSPVLRPIDICRCASGMCHSLAYLQTDLTCVMERSLRDLKYRYITRLDQ